MRTAASLSLCRLRWPAAFSTKPYRTSASVFWQHVFEFDTPMTNWFGGSILPLKWTPETGLSGRRRRHTPRSPHSLQTLRVTKPSQIDALSTFPHSR